MTVALLTYDPAVSANLTVGVDARALIGEATGIGVYCRAVLQGLVEVTGVTPIAMAHAPITELPVSSGVEHSVRSAPSGVLWQQLVFKRQAAERGCDLLWSPVFTLPRNPGLPAVVTVHDMTAWRFPQTHRLKVRASIRPLFARSVREATTIVTPSAYTADDLARDYPEASEKTEVIPHGVDAGFVPGDRESIAATRQELGIEDGYLIYSGTLEPRKNLDTLIEVWSDLREREQAPALVVVGGVGWKSDMTLARMRALETRGLHYLGRLSRQRQIAVLQAATALVYPSIYEGFGLPTLEAMACAVPVISSDRSSLPEVVGNAGVLVDPDDRAELAEAIRTVCADPALAKELAERGLERSRAFTWRRSVSAHVEVFRRAAGGHR